MPTVLTIAPETPRPLVPPRKRWTRELCAPLAASGLFEGESLVNTEAPIDVSPEDNPTNEPEPDLIVLKREFTNFRSGNPQPQDLSS